MIAQGKPKQAKVGSTRNVPVRGPIDVDTLWLHLPTELVRKIASELQPTHMTFVNQEHLRPDRTTLTMARNLMRLAMADRSTFSCVWGLLYWARWAVELAQLHFNSDPPRAIPVDFLLSDPTATDHGNVLAFAPSGYEDRRLDSLLQGTLVVASGYKTDPFWNGILGTSSTPTRLSKLRDRSEQAERLLTRLFDAWCQRLQKAVDTSAQLTHLPLDDLPLRVFRCMPANDSSTLDPDFLRHAVGFEDPLAIPLTSKPVKLLLQHLKCMDEDLKLFVWLHLDLLLASDDAHKQGEVTRALSKYGVADDEVIAKAKRWQDGFLKNLDESQTPDDDVVMEVWEGLQSMPLLGAAVPLFMIIKFACMPSRDASITDEHLIQLLHRAMVEMAEMLPGVSGNRLDYVVLRAPKELGVAAFERLTHDQRESLFNMGSPDDEDFEDAYRPYQGVLTIRTDTPAGQTAPFS